ncbi:putative peptidoglycan lipid II flippase [Glaciihabitans tibetensis]|uniref:Putative peptidoglycan lipid II flippase n=1 Tax=Glaciihabitans tibetensis TaxID=1266600 RepID=A0A2T0VCS9_9MICO|nr:murein biosynthesis integral membrane protein MurJ [Glaciihabitans tibetensis]PRY67981.1 putative peptidoglycan lipid II flippase [Glaciihabitans tibetensis]
MSVAPAAAEPSGIGRASAFLASGTMVSRLLGFASAALLAQTLGSQGVGATTFALANQLPNNIYALVAGGILSAVLVPQIVRANLHDDGGQKFINRIVTLGSVVFLAAAVIATVCAPLLVRLYASAADDGGRGMTGDELGLATAFAYWCLPQILFYALYSLLGEVLNARKVFGPFTWAPVLNNVVAIGGLLAFNVAFDSGDLSAVSDWTPSMIVLLAGSATLGVAAQAFVLFLFWRRAGLSYRPEFRWRGVGLGRVGKAAGWTFGMIVVSQLAGIVQSRVATGAGTDDASVAALRYAWLIFMLPHSIVTVSVATAYFTRMSTHARDRNFTAVRKDISASLRTIGMIMVFAAVGLIVLAYPFSTIFSKSVGEAFAMGNVLIGFLAGLISFTVLFVLQRSFYALEDTRTPFLIQVVQSAIFVVGALVVSSFPEDAVAVGLAWVTTIAGTIQVLITAVVLRRRLGGLDARHILKRYLTYVLATLPAAAVGIGITASFGGFTGGYAMSGIFPAMLTMIVAGGVMLVLYVAVLTVLRNPELRALIVPVTARLRGRS